MSGLKRIGTLSLLLVLATICYSVGLMSSVMIIVGLGVIFELAFWFGLLKR